MHKDKASLQKAIFTATQSDNQYIKDAPNERNQQIRDSKGSIEAICWCMESWLANDSVNNYHVFDDCREYHEGSQ